MLEDKIIGVDLGGTRVRASLMTTEGTVLARISRATEAKQGLDHVLSNIESVINTVKGSYSTDEIIGIGIGSPGPLNSKTGVVFCPPNLPGWTNVPLRDILEQRTGLPTFVGNDANLAALGEYTFGAAKNYRYAVYITISTGIGAGIIEDGRLLEGAKGAAGEVGHMTIDVNGPVCNCGNIGCWEVMASGTAIGRRAREFLASSNEPSLMRELCAGNLALVNAEIVEQAARQGDAVAKQQLQETARYLGAGVTNVLHLYNPEIVVIGGGVAQMGDLMFEPLKAEVEKRAMPAYRENVPIVPTVLGGDIGLYGAVAVVLANTEIALTRKQELRQPATY
jgi:glucokinase